MILSDLTCLNSLGENFGLYVRIQMCRAMDNGNFQFELLDQNVLFLLRAIITVGNDAKEATVSTLTTQQP